MPCHSSDPSLHLASFALHLTGEVAKVVTVEFPFQCGLAYLPLDKLLADRKRRTVKKNCSERAEKVAEVIVEKEPEVIVEKVAEVVVCKQCANKYINIDHVWFYLSWYQVFWNWDANLFY